MIICIILLFLNIITIFRLIKSINTEILLGGKYLERIKFYNQCYTPVKMSSYILIKVYLINFTSGLYAIAFGFNA